MVDWQPALPHTPQEALSAANYLSLLAHTKGRTFDSWSMSPSQSTAGGSLSSKTVALTHSTMVTPSTHINTHFPEQASQDPWDHAGTADRWTQAPLIHHAGRGLHAEAWASVVKSQSPIGKYKLKNVGLSFQ